MQARDEAQLPPTEAEAASGQPAGQYLNPPKRSGFNSKIQLCYSIVKDSNADSGVI